MKFKPVITVAFQPEPEFANVIEEILKGSAVVRYIYGVEAEKREGIIAGSDAVVAASCSPSEISPSEALLLKPGALLQLLFSGADNVPFDILPDSVVIASNAGAFAEPIAEHVLAMTLCLVKKIVQRNDDLKRGVFDQAGFSGTLRGKVCGILGFGGNGKAIARSMKLAGMKVGAVNRSGVTDELVDNIWGSERIDDLLKVSDVLVLTIPLTTATKGLIGERELSLMKPDAILVNVARGAVVDQDALYRHMLSHPDFGAAVDTWWTEPSSHGVFELEHPFFELPNFVGSPHVADHVPGMMPEAVRSAFENVKNFLAGKTVRGVVNREEYL